MTTTGGLFDGFEGYKTLTTEKLRTALRESMVVFDANVLLNLYRYSDVTLSSMVEVIAAIDDRFWLPRQVVEEFWRNRERALPGPLAEVKESLADLDKQLGASVEGLRRWVNRGSLAAEDAQGVEQGLKASFEAARTLVAGLADPTQLDRSRDAEHDRVILLLAPVLEGRVGPPMSAASYAAACVEGNRRVSEREPPGYADVKKQGLATKEGAAGDYLVWEQLLIQVEQTPQSVVFVTGDLKEDWWRLESKSVRGPRIELEREFRGRCGCDLYMIRPEDVLRVADIFSVSVAPRSLEDVERATRAEVDDVSESSGSTGWSALAVKILLDRLTSEAPVQEATIRVAAASGGQITREEVYSLGGYPTTRQLKGFTRPINRIVDQLRNEGKLPEDAGEALYPIYEERTYGVGWVDGFRVPQEIVDLI